MNFHYFFNMQISTISYSHSVNYHFLGSNTPKLITFTQQEQTGEITKFTSPPLATMAARHRQMWKEVIGSIYYRLARAFEWSPVSRTKPISKDKYFIYRLFQDGIYYGNLKYLYILYSFMSASFLLLFILEENVTHRVQVYNIYINGWTIVAFTLFNIFYHGCLFTAMKVNKIQIKIKWFLFILNGISVLLLYEMAIIYGNHFGLAESRIEEVIVSVLCISMSTFYFQGTFLGSVIFWTHISVRCFTSIFSAEDKGNHKEVVSLSLDL